MSNLNSAYLDYVVHGSSVNGKLTQAVLCFNFFYFYFFLTFLFVEQGVSRKASKNSVKGLWCDEGLGFNVAGMRSRSERGSP